MKRILALLIAVICLISLDACKKQPAEQPAQPDEPIADETPTFSIETPYAKLRVPEEFETEVKTEVTSEEPYVLSFKTTDGADLFAIHFDDKTDNLLGTLELEDKNVVLYATFAKLNENDSQYTKRAGLQLGISTIIENLVADYGFVPNEVVEATSDDSFEIKTDVVTLQYPAVWKDKVTVDVADGKAAFSCGETKLFDLLFTDSDGYLLGTYDGTPISIVTYDIDKDGKTDEEIQELLAMQQNVNYIIDKLTQDSKFVIAE